MTPFLIIVTSDVQTTLGECFRDTYIVRKQDFKMAAILRALAQTRSSCNSIIRVKQPVAHLHTTRTFHIKDSLKDRNSINTESNEYSKSGSDEAAAQKDTAFKTGESTPEAEMGSQEKVRVMIY